MENEASCVGLSHVFICVQNLGPSDEQLRRAVSEEERPLKEAFVALEALCKSIASVGLKLGHDKRALAVSRLDIPRTRLPAATRHLQER